MSGHLSGFDGLEYIFWSSLGFLFMDNANIGKGLWGKLYGIDG